MFRIAAFIDPLLNPLLVAVRTPAIRRKLRHHFYLTLQIFCAIFCPCWRKQLLLPKHKRGRDSVLVAKRRRQTASLPYGRPISMIAARRASVGSYLSFNGSETGKCANFGLLCSGRVNKLSFLKITKILFSLFATNSNAKTVVLLKWILLCEIKRKFENEITFGKDSNLFVFWITAPLLP